MKCKKGYRKVGNSCRKATSSGGSSRRDRPVLLTLIATIILILSIPSILGGLLLGGIGLFGMSSSSTLLQFGSMFLIGAGAILILVGLFNFIISIGLYKGKGWARILAIIVHGFSAISSIISMFSLSAIISGVTGLFTGATFIAIGVLAWNVFVALYLIFSKSANDYFRR